MANPQNTHNTTHTSWRADAIIAVLDRAGLRQTKPRRAIAEVLADLAEQGADFAAEDLWHTVRIAAPSLGRATTFRTLERLVELGILDRVTFADGSERYHACQQPGHHHHLTCESCHRVIEIQTCIPQQTLQDVAHHAGFVLTGHRIEIYGQCPDCKGAIDS